MNIYTGLVFLFGAIVGSFLNVCIYRLPRKESILWPASSCPVCKHPIQYWQNIPILSFIALKGKCSNCKTRIPVTYPLVELLTGLLLAVIWTLDGFSFSFLSHAILILFLLPISFIDLNHKLILNVLTFPAIVIGLALAVLLQSVSLTEAMLGLFLGGGFLWLVGLLGNTLFKQESMGGGDIKLGAMIGVFLGPQVVVALFLAFFLALPAVAIGLLTKKLRMGSTLPFGPFIALATVLLICFGPAFYHRYLLLFS